MTKFKKVVVLSPHTDDGELGAGGFISKLIEDGSEVYYFAFSTAEESVPDGYEKDILKKEVLLATSCLGIKKDNVKLFQYKVRYLGDHRQEILEELITIRNSFEPDLVLIPSVKDVHQDHATIAQEGIRAYRHSTILGYELIWNNLNFDSSCFVPLTEKQLKKKIESLSKYSSQSSKQYMSKSFIKSLAETRGVQIGTKYAECFEVIRWLIR